MAHVIRIGSAGQARIISLAVFFLIFSFCAFGQQPTCTVSSLAPTVHAEGLAEQVSDISFVCSGGSGTVTTLLAVTLNANITNRLDVNGNLTNVTINGAATSLQLPTLNSPKTLLFGVVQLPGASAVFTITGVRAAVATVSGGGATPIVTGSVYADQLSLPSQQLFLATGAPTLLSSVVNYGVPCAGSPSPATQDFPGLIAAGTIASTIRVTDAVVGAFSPRAPTADFGVRFLVNISGYGPNAQVFVPDVIVGGITTPTPTSGGDFNTTTNGGTYTPGTNQLLLTRVNGADATGAGGSLFLSAAPGAAQSFTSVTQLNLVNGAASVTYEVLASTPGVIESAQIPVFVAVPATSCSTVLESTLGATLAPASTVSVATQTDPIPRYIATTPASDCTLIGDCTASYFPTLQVAPASITLNGFQQEPVQTSLIAVGNGGSGQLTFNVSIAYQTAANQSTANWLSVSPATGVVGATAGITSFAVTLSADPSNLQIQGAYQATVTINAGTAGTVTVPVTFNIGPPGLFIQSIVNAANSQPGPVTVGSFVAVYGLNLAPKTSAPPMVTFNGFPGVVSFDGATQINVLVPAGLGSASVAGVVATIDGVPSNTFALSLVANAPAVFNPGILNQDNSVNLASAPESLGQIIQIFLTGLATPVTLPVTVNIGNQAISGNQIIYAGPVPSVPGLEQVNVQVPTGLTFTGNSAPLTICVPGTSGKPNCSAPVPLYLH
jgi:uncharacterized protein (TIGR03437 family)